MPVIGNGKLGSGVLIDAGGTDEQVELRVRMPRVRLCQSYYGLRLFALPPRAY